MKAVPHAVVARQQEQRRAEALGGRRTKGSGNRPGDRGDVATAGALAELKFTYAATFRVTRTLLAKIEREATAVTKWPWVEVEFRDTARRQPRVTWVLVPCWVLDACGIRLRGWRVWPSVLCLRRDEVLPARAALLLQAGSAGAWLAMPSTSAARVLPWWLGPSGGRHGAR